MVPLTDEEKACKIKELKEKLNEKRILQKIREEQEARENEVSEKWYIYVLILLKVDSSQKRSGVCAIN